MDVFELYEKDVRPTMMVEQPKDDEAMFDIEESGNHNAGEQTNAEKTFNISDEQKAVLFEEFKKMMSTQSEETKED